MKLNNLYSINKVLKLWRSRGSAIQKVCSAELIKLGIKEVPRLLGDAKSVGVHETLIGGQVAIGDGSLGNSCEIHIILGGSWEKTIGKLLTSLVVKKARTVEVEVFETYVDIKFDGDSGIHYIIRLCSESHAPKAWWIYGYLMSEVILAPVRIHTIKKWLDCGIDINDAFALGMQELSESKLWSDMGEFVIDYNAEECKKIVSFIKSDFGWRRFEPVVALVG